MRVSFRTPRLISSISRFARHERPPDPAINLGMTPTRERCCRVRRDGTERWADQNSFFERFCHRSRGFQVEQVAMPTRTRAVDTISPGETSIGINKNERHSPNALFCQSLPILDRAQQIDLVGISMSTKSQSRTLGRISDVMRSKLCEERETVRLAPQTRRKDGVKDLPLGSTSNPLLLRYGPILVVNVYEQSSRAPTMPLTGLKSQN